MNTKDFEIRLLSLLKDDSLFDYLDSLPDNDFDFINNQDNNAVTKLSQLIQDKYSWPAIEADELANEFICAHY